MRTSCSLSSKLNQPNPTLPTEFITSPPLCILSSKPTWYPTHEKRPSRLFESLKEFFWSLFYGSTSTSFSYNSHATYSHFVLLPTESFENNTSNPCIRSSVPLLLRYPEFSTTYSFLLKKSIGKGTYGTIYLASCKHNPTKLFAVKVFNKCRTISNQEKYQTRLSSEFITGTLLNHKNIIKMYELIKIKERWFLIMEYCHGGDLFSFIQKNKPQPMQADIFLMELLDGIHYLHSVGIAHCDLKPENILLTKDHHIKIADFGLAQEFSNRASPIKADFFSYHNSAQGSRPYSAPELLTFIDYSLVDLAPIDVWALGIIYFVMVFHKIPWNEASTEDERYAKYLAQRTKFEPINRLPASMAKILCQILEPDPKIRITVDELLESPYLQNIFKDP